MMKKWLLFCLIAFCLSLFAACSQPVEYSAWINGRDYLLDTASQTISDGVNTFSYTASGTKDRYTVEISYPDGTSYVWKQSGEGGSGGWRAGLTDEYQYNVDGSDLCDLVVKTLPDPPNYGLIILAVILAGIGIFNIARPRAAWFLNIGWKFKDAEPSEEAISAHVIGGIFAVALALFLFLIPVLNLL